MDIIHDFKIWISANFPKGTLATHSNLAAAQDVELHSDP